MAVDGDLQRHHGSRRRRRGFSAAPRRSITLAGRCISRSTSRGVSLAVEQIAQQLVLLRPDARKARDRRKQRIEQSRAHRIIRHMAGLSVEVRAADATVIIPRGEGLTSAILDRYINLARHHVRAFGVGWVLKMTGTTRSSGGLDDRRKRLLFRCWHRGTREMDLILGRFADAEIATAIRNWNQYMRAWCTIRCVGDLGWIADAPEVAAGSSPCSLDASDVQREFCGIQRLPGARRPSTGLSASERRTVSEPAVVSRYRHEGASPLG